MADSLKTLLGLDSTGGGAWPINAVIAINDDADLRVKNGQTWLKTGVIKTDKILYPDARVSGQPFFTGDSLTNLENKLPSSFGVNSFRSIVSGFDSSTFWVFGVGSDDTPDDSLAFEFDLSGNYLSYVNLSSKPGGFISLGDATKDDSFYYVIDKNGDAIKKYDANWTYIDSISNPLTTQNSMTAICFDGIYFYISENANVVEKFGQSFSSTGESFTLNPGTLGGVASLEIVNNDLFLLSSATDTITSWSSSDGSKKSVDFSFSSVSSSPGGLSFFDDRLRFLYDTTVSDINVTPYIGIKDYYTDSETGIPYYVRVK